jgi:putative transposase
MGWWRRIEATCHAPDRCRNGGSELAREDLALCAEGAEDASVPWCGGGSVEVYFNGIGIGMKMLEGPRGLQGLAVFRQGSQFSSSDWQSFLKVNNVISSMRRRAKSHDHAVAESFFQPSKRERIRRNIYTTCEKSRSDNFDGIEMFDNLKRRHSSAI